MDQEIDEYFRSALKLTKEAGKIIVEGLHSIKTISSKTSTSDIVTNYDLKSSIFPTVVRLRLLHFRVNGVFIGEEDQFIKGTSIVLTDSPTWIIDPIDGTQNFVHALHFVYISIALSINKQVVLGIAYNPILDILFTAKKGQGAYLNSQPIHVSQVTVSFLLSDENNSQVQFKLTLITLAAFPDTTLH
ncbi:unnamed protein product [Timema podura]|uniref:inositol-phosphate phosphatase n=1 Tax=Timema podura TaxID=61482 RepID=A0ABN7NM61_TIMPD|nr:unnamed protein product [Timema podura]